MKFNLNLNKFAQILTIVSFNHDHKLTIIYNPPYLIKIAPYNNLAFSPLKRNDFAGILKRKIKNCPLKSKFFNGILKSKPKPLYIQIDESNINKKRYILMVVK